MCTLVALASQSLQRRPRPYTHSPWGDFFLNHQTCTPSQLSSMKEEAHAKKEEVRHIIMDGIGSSNLIRKLELVDTLQRTGVDYHYKEEIHELLRHVYDDEDGGSDDLYATSLRFYLLRKHGYPVPSDEQGDVSSDDVNCLLRLYDAAHLRTHGEQILDNIITFNKSRLNSLIKTNLEPDLAKEVRITLETPRFRRVKRVEAQRYILVYEKKATRDETILKFAKLEYNISQAIYCEELKQLTIWWRDFQSRIELSFARDRMVELHFWVLGIVYEPHYSFARIVMTKFLVLVSLLDDLYDNYMATEESNIFTKALERWDERTTETLPAYLKEILINILDTTNKVEEDLNLQKNKHAKIFKKMVIDTAKFYHAEVKWREERYVPATVEEHLVISLRSAVCMQLVCLALTSLPGDVASREEVIAWALTFPKSIRGVSIVGRVGNDIVSHEREQASEHVASTVQTCVKQYGVTVEEANEKLRSIVEEAWMDIVEECLDRKHPTELLEKPVNVAQTMDFMYKREDTFTLSFSLKDVIASMYVNLV